MKFAKNLSKNVTCFDNFIKPTKLQDFVKLSKLVLFFERFLSNFPLIDIANHQFVILNVKACHIQKLMVPTLSHRLATIMKILESSFPELHKSKPSGSFYQKIKNVKKVI